MSRTTYTYRLSYCVWFNIIVQCSCCTDVVNLKLKVTLCIVVNSLNPWPSEGLYQWGLHHLVVLQFQSTTTWMKRRKVYFQAGGGKVYHLGCLLCSQCNKRFSEDHAPNLASDGESCFCGNHVTIVARFAWFFVFSQSRVTSITRYLYHAPYKSRVTISDALYS